MNLFNRDRKKKASKVRDGAYNALSGMGGGADKSQGSVLMRTVVNKDMLQTLYVESWAAGKFIDIPVDDMFIRERSINDDERIQDAIAEQGKLFDVQGQLAKVIKSSRLYGSALLVVVSLEAPLSEPLQLDRVREGDVKNILVVDRYSCTVASRNGDVFSSGYGQAEHYTINLNGGGSMVVHASRVIRFDGTHPLSDEGWTGYERDWGVSKIVSTMNAILSEEGLAQNVGHLTHEASIPVLKINDFEDALQGNEEAELPLSERLQGVNSFKSIYRTLFIGEGDEFTRQDVKFTGLPDIMDRFAKRLAAAADIPATRFWGQSPLGMNATGEGDQVNYAMHVAAMQTKMLPPAYEMLDAVLLRNAGLKDERVNYTFPSLINISEKDQAEIAAKKMDTVTKGLAASVLDEDEARAILDGDGVIGELADLSEV